ALHFGSRLTQAKPLESSEGKGNYLMAKPSCAGSS
ncbi:hypothetical protein CCACVL1_27708, partial [Corchorus capsularis]